MPGGAGATLSSVGMPGVDASSPTGGASGAARCYIVGLGASAGGFEALEEFFQNVPVDTGMAFVVVQHLSPDHKSLMVELLGKSSTLRFMQAQDDQPVEPNSVYLIPPGKLLAIHKGRLRLTEKPGAASLSFPIDLFLTSLAEDQGDRAIAIILSGTGSDGARGVRVVKEHGGVVMVQDARSAKFDGMPSSALATGVADYVLVPSAMPGELVKYISHPYALQREKGRLPLLKEGGRLSRIFQVIYEQTGLDFSLYKQQTLLRRIERRMGVNQIESLDDYLGYMKQYPREVDILVKDFLIGVTRFFRDPEAFAILKERVIPEIFRMKSRTEALRIWAPGCATGEEAYSLAICFREHMEATGDHREIKIFATDIDAAALEYASAGVYPESILADMSKEQFSRFFISKGDRRRVVNQLREMVIFAMHNLIKDPPFNRVDLIACRNVLIYLQPDLQKKVFTHFNFGLTPRGFLFLGSSETVGEFANYFDAFDVRWKIFRSRGARLPLPAESYQPSPVAKRRSELTLYESLAPPEVNARRSLGRIYEYLLNEAAPPSCVVDERLELLHVLGDVSEFLQLKPGNINLRITSLARRELAVSLETALNKALRDNIMVTYQAIRLKAHGEAKEVGERAVWVGLTVAPFEPHQSDAHEGTLLLVIFQRYESRGNEVEPLPPHCDEGSAGQRILDLEHELQFARENLQATIEELETTNEELQAANEELLSSNEELQSANEELQSVNEELVTVNAEFQGKIHELTELNNDMLNFLGSADIATVFLDGELTIRKFTPAVSDTLNLLQGDVGRPLRHIAHNLRDVPLMEIAERVARDHVPEEHEVQLRNGRWLLLRAHPYRTEHGAYRGVVLNVIDIDAYKRATIELTKLSRAVEESPSIVSITDPAGDIQYVNRTFERVTGYARGEIVGQSHRVLKSGEMDEEDYAAMWRMLEAGNRWEGVFLNRAKNGRRYYEHATIVPIQLEEGAPTHYLKVATDVTERKRAQDLLEASRLRMTRLLERSSDGYLELDANDRVTYANDRCVAMLGLSRRALLGRDLWDAAPALLATALPETLQAVRGQCEALVATLRLPKESGSQASAELEEAQRVLEAHVLAESEPTICDPPQPAADGDTTSVTGKALRTVEGSGVSLFFRDITHTRTTEQAVAPWTAGQPDDHLDASFEHAPVALLHLDDAGRVLLANGRARLLLGESPPPAGRLLGELVGAPAAVNEALAALTSRHKSRAVLPVTPPAAAGAPCACSITALMREDEVQAAAGSEPERHGVPAFVVALTEAALHPTPAAGDTAVQGDA